jgi:DNA-binding LytR/AlgR family response regulator
MVYKIAICDDERAQTGYLSALVRRWAGSNNDTAEIKVFESAEAFLFAYSDDKDIDILLLDIQMKTMDGIGLAKEIRKDNNSVQIIFITGYPEYISQGYEVSALHYLMKPVSETKLCEVLSKACKNLAKTDRTILLDTDRGIIRLPTDSIIFAEAFLHTIVIQTTDNTFEAKMSISDAERLFGEGFVRCHRSYIAGLRFIKKITKTDIVFDNNKTIPLSRSSYDKVNQSFIKYFRGE